MCQAPRSHPCTSKTLLLFKVLWIFPKRRLNKYKKMCPLPFHHHLFGQIIRDMSCKYFPALLSRMLESLRRAERVRGLASLMPEEVLLLNFTRQSFHLWGVFSSLSENLRHTDDGNREMLERQATTRAYRIFPIIFSYPCKAGCSCTRSRRRRRCTSPG